MVGVDRLRRPGERVDSLGHDCGGDDRRMQERALADEAVRIRDTASQQERGRADRAAQPRHKRARGSRSAARSCERRACPSLRRTSAVTRSPPWANSSARARVTRVAPRSSAAGTVVIEHRLLRVDRAAHAAVAEIPAALDVAAIAADWMPSAAAPRASASLFAFGGTFHGAMPSLALHRARTTARDPRSANPSSPNARCQYARVVSGVRNELVQLTVVPPPTQRPCRMPIALSRVLRAADSW